MLATVQIWQPAQNELGEGVLWDPRASRVHWVDILAGAVLTRSLAGAAERVEIGEQVGCVGLTDTPDVLVAGTRGGWKVLNLATSTLTPIADPELDRPECRFNDGSIDSMGRFWTGSLEDGERRPVGRLYRLDPDRSVHLIDEGFYCPNGIDWSPDGSSMYFVDSRRDVVFRYQFDPQTGLVGERRPFLDTSGTDGIPDGLCVDADGNVWIAFWDGGHVSRFGPDGVHQIRIDVPVPRPTSVALGGPDLHHLFITSARTGLTPQTLAEAPASGSVLLTQADVPGLAPHYFPLAEGPMR